MDATTETAPARTGRGRWAPGQSGNPAGKKLGTRNRATVLRELLAEGEETLVARALMDRVRAGDSVAVRFVAERLFPKPRDRDIDTGLSPDATPVEMLDRLVRLMMAGEISIDEASRMCRVVDQLPAAAREKRVAAPAAVAAVSPAFDLHPAGADAPSEPVPPPRPLNRHERRRLAALERAAPAPAGAGTPLSAAA